MAEFIGNEEDRGAVTSITQNARQSRGVGASIFVRLCVVLLPSALILAFILPYAMHIPYWDSWEWVRILKMFRSGERDFMSILLMTHNEHPYGLPTLLFLGVGGFVHYGMAPFALISCLLMVGVGALLGNFATRLTGASAPLTAAIVILSVSPRHWENQIFGFQVGFPLAVLLCLGAIACAARVADREKASWWGVAATLACLAGAGLCSAASFAAFAAVGAVLLTGESTRHQRVALVLCGALAVAWFAQFVPPILALDHGMHVPWGSRIEGLFILAGAPLFAELKPASLVGGSVLAAFGVLGPLAVRRGPNHRALVAVGLLSLAFCAAVAYGRNVVDGNMSRYAIYSVPLMVVAMTLVLERLRGRWRDAAIWLVLVAVCLSAAWASVTAKSAVQRFHLEEIGLTDIVLNAHERSEADVRRLHPGGRAYTLPLIDYFLKVHPGLALPVTFRSVAVTALDDAQGATHTAVAADYTMRGPGYVYAAAPCKSCVLRWEVSGVTADKGTVGAIFRDAKGDEVANTYTLIDGARQDDVAYVVAAPPEAVSFEAYVWSPGPAVSFSNPRLGTSTP